ncbi:MAG: pantoate--beta-alanine ligase [Bauldia sp.]
MTSPVPIDRTVAGIRGRTGAWQQDGLRVGLVPTMGALHRGHLALVETLRATADRVVVSIFVNPTQFAPGEDFAAYPRDEAADLALLASAGVNAVFAPAVDAMYPDGFATTVTVGGPADGLESDFRPHFFAGVATVVAKLLLSCVPDVAIFGEKDYQQLAVIQRMVADLTIPTAIAGHPTVREADGLALSSRNAYLSPEERKIAPGLHAVLNEAAMGIRGQNEPMEVLLGARRALADLGFKVDYVEARNAETLAPVVEYGKEPIRLLAAARLGKTRLVDNIGV